MNHCHAYRPSLRASGILVVVQLLAACNAPLPEPESPGAKVYASRCNTCHRLYAPSAMTYEMWKMKVALMQGEMVRRGLPPLTREEREVLLEYLRRHSQGAAISSDEVNG